MLLTARIKTCHHLTRKLAKENTHTHTHSLTLSTKITARPTRHFLPKDCFSFWYNVYVFSPALLTGPSKSSLTAPLLVYMNWPITGVFLPPLESLRPRLGTKTSDKKAPHSGLHTSSDWPLYLRSQRQQSSRPVKQDFSKHPSLWSTLHIEVRGSAPQRHSQQAFNTSFFITHLPVYCREKAPRH